MIKCKGFNNTHGNLEIDIVQQRDNSFRVAVWKPDNDLVAQITVASMYEVSTYLGDFVLRLQVGSNLVDLLPLQRNKRPEAIRKFFIRCEVE